MHCVINSTFQLFLIDFMILTMAQLTLDQTLTIALRTVLSTELSFRNSIISTNGVEALADHLVRFWNVHDHGRMYTDGSEPRQKDDGQL